MNKKHIFIGILIVIALHYIFYLLGTIKITARFQELEPFRHNISVYYKGFRLGKTTKIRPGKDYQSTLIDMRIKDKNLKLPANTEIVLRRKDKKDYIELVYPYANVFCKFFSLNWNHAVSLAMFLVAFGNTNCLFTQRVITTI